MNPKILWERCLVEIELSVSRSNFNTWFKDTSIAKVQDGTVYLRVPSLFVKEWLQSKFHNFILKIIRQNDSSIRALSYTVSKVNEKKKVDLGPSKKDEAELPLRNTFKNPADNLNPRYTFESFVVGPFNELAYAAAQAVSKRPGQSYNPLFIYGNTGHGKTHLIQAVGNHIKDENPHLKVFYLTSERFALDYINSVQQSRTNGFKEKYRAYDVLIMDDIQFMSNKEKTQEELFHLFNTLYEQNKQIVFSSDKHPHHITGLEERLQSRFGAGMIVDIPSPDNESRGAILRAKARQAGVSVEKEVLEYLARTITSNVRELEGAMNTIAIQTEVKGEALSIDEAKRLVKASIQQSKQTSPEDIVRIVSDFYNIPEEMIYQKSRKKEVIKPRQLAMYILREDYNISFPSIGEKIGKRDHTTVMHSCEKISEKLKTDAVLNEEVEQIRNILSH
jgi:chromosomal replication initiator protein